MSFSPIHEYLNSFANFESHLHTIKAEDFDLTRVAEMLDSIGSPHKELKIIHVAGTKGKGSTCIFLSQILARSGYKVGLYTSPHLHRLNERIRILHKEIMADDDDFLGCISDDRLASIVNVLRPKVAALSNRGINLTFFEMLTVIAFAYFKEEQVDWVVLETGLGGRLDATNVAESQIALITPISLDHTKLLGETIGEIAFEKSGIIKNSKQRVVIAPQEPEAMDVILKRCREFGIPPISVDKNKYKDLKVTLKGEHQRINAACALAVVELLKLWNYPISDEAIATTWQRVKWAGRFEKIQGNPVIIVDGAHNVASARALAATVTDQYPGRKVILILGMSQDKDIGGFIEEIKGLSDIIVLTRSTHARAHVFSADEAKRYFNHKDWSITTNVADALELAKSKAKNEDVIVVTGSLFVCANARSGPFPSKPLAP